MSLQTIEVTSTDQPAASVIVLHGLGADGTDFLPFADEVKLSAAVCPALRLSKAPFARICNPCVLLFSYQLMRNKIYFY